jgi:hypothetical protein
MLQKQSRRVSLQLRAPQTAVRKVVRNHLNLHAYKVYILQTLKSEDKLHRFQFAKGILSNTKITSGVGYSLIKQRLSYKGGKISAVTQQILKSN